MKPKNSLRHFLLLAGSSLMAVSSSYAQAIDWNGDGADDNLTTSANWVGSPTPVLTTNVFKFIGNTRNAPVNDFAVDTVLGNSGGNLFWFTNNGTAGQTNAFNLTGNDITTNTGNTPIVTTAIAGGGTPITSTVGLNMTLGGNLVFQPGVGHDLILSGNISQDASNRQFIFQGQGGSNVTLSGDNSIAGAVSIFFGGTVNINTLTDSGVNSSIGRVATILFNQSTTGTLNYTGGATETNRQFSLGGNATTANNGTFNNNGTGAVVFDNAFFNAAPANISSAVSRTMVLGGANTDANEIQGVIRDNGTPLAGGTNVVNVTKADAGLWILSGSNTYTGLTSVNGGTLLTTRAAALPGFNAADRVAVASGATLGVRAGAAGQWTSGELDSLLGATTAAFASGSNLGVDVLTGDTFIYANNIGATQAAKGLVKSGAGTLTLSHANTHTGNTLVTGGKIALGDALALQNSAFDTASVNGGLDVTGYPPQLWVASRVAWIFRPR